MQSLSQSGPGPRCGRSRARSSWRRGSSRSLARWVHSRGPPSCGCLLFAVAALCPLLQASCLLRYAPCACLTGPVAPLWLLAVRRVRCSLPCLPPSLPHCGLSPCPLLCCCLARCSSPTVCLAPPRVGAVAVAGGCEERWGWGEGGHVGGPAPASTGHCHAEAAAWGRCRGRVHGGVAAAGGGDPGGGAGRRGAPATRGRRRPGAPRTMSRWGAA